MNKSRLIALVVVLGSLVACGDGINDSKKSPNTKSSAQQQDARQFVVANNFSDAEWKNGVQQKEGRTNVFYFLQKNGEPLNLKVGDTLSFAKTGNAAVQKIAPSAPNQNGIISVFVTIDRDIDPIGDGFPNKVFLQSKAIQLL